MFLFVVYVPLQFAFGAVQLASHLEIRQHAVAKVFFFSKTIYVLCIYIYRDVYSYGLGCVMWYILYL